MSDIIEHNWDFNGTYTNHHIVESWNNPMELLSDRKDWLCLSCGRARYYSIDGSYNRNDGSIGYINDKCTDCCEKDPIYPRDSIVFVKAWWNSQKPVKCLVHSHRVGNTHMDVRPIEGNPHMRFINVSDIIIEKSDYREEMDDLHVNLGI